MVPRALPLAYLPAVAHLPLVDAIPSISCTSDDLQMHLHQYHSRPGVGIPAYSLEEFPHIQSTLLLLEMKTDMPSPLRLRRKWLQLCNMRSTTQPITEHHKVKVRREHKVPKSVHKDSRRRSPLSLCKIHFPA
ncbi:hypothetical protein M405DRAFT_827190 [Rhizopogon salebrosus TDB-379]|nr:hypothetical protein M405DRAFT_827190 [Rhizopogon salebrosus TDB-379]